LALVAALIESLLALEAVHSGLSMRQGLGQLLGSSGTERHPIEPGLGIEIVFARFVDDPQHTLSGILFNQLIEPTKLEIIARNVSGILFSQTNHEF
jgi:hypothetical protein